MSFVGVFSKYKSSAWCPSGYIPVQGGYIPVQGGYIPVQGGYIVMSNGTKKKNKWINYQK